MLLDLCKKNEGNSFSTKIWVVGSYTDTLLKTVSTTACTSLKILIAYCKLSRHAATIAEHKSCKTFLSDQQSLACKCLLILLFTEFIRDLSLNEKISSMHCFDSFQRHWSHLSGGSTSLVNKKPRMSLNKVKSAYEPSGPSGRRLSPVSVVWSD